VVAGGPAVRDDFGHHWLQGAGYQGVVQGAGGRVWCRGRGRDCGCGHQMVGGRTSGVNPTINTAGEPTSKMVSA
jgi:hypothetical protein